LARSLKVVNETLTSLDLGFNEIRVNTPFSTHYMSGQWGIALRFSFQENFLMLQDKGAFSLAQALKANPDAAVTSLNLTNNFFTKYGQVSV
jgi:hypothetical protein